MITLKPRPIRYHHVVLWFIAAAASFVAAGSSYLGGTGLHWLFFSNAILFTAVAINARPR